MLNKKNRFTIMVVLLAGIIALMAGWFAAKHLYVKKAHNIAELTGTQLDTPRHLQDFILTSTDNTPFDNASLQGHWTMVFFGFTRCGYLCPTTMAELGKMYRLLEAQKVANLPQVVMISVDPARDTLNKLKHYVYAFDKHFSGAIGTESAIKKLTSELGIAYLKVAPSNTKGTYDIEHTGTIMLLNPRGDLVAFFTTPHDASKLAHDYIVLSA